MGMMAEQDVKILVVDDDPFLRKTIPFRLRSRGYEVETAENGAEALEVFVADPEITLIISDMVMPRMGGLELIREIRRIDADIPLIILTSENRISVAIEAMNRGANDYLLKDGNILQTVFISVEKVLEKYWLKQKNRGLMADLAQKNRELEKSNRELVELNRLKNKFLGIAAHDLRNPLISIRGLSELMGDGAFGPLGDDQAEYVRIISSTANGMLALVNDLLDVSVIESGKLDLTLSEGSLGDLIADRIRTNRVLADKKGISVCMRLADLPKVMMDRGRVAQVFDNLFSNAVKFSPRETQVLITLARERGMAKVSVMDQGPGIPEEEQSRLFGEFQKLSVRPTAGEKSTGLGLAIVKKIVEAHGGHLGVLSRPGAGSTFSFNIPMEGKNDSE